MSWLLLAGAQEALYARIRFAEDIRQHIVGTILLLLALGLFYLYACHRSMALERTQPARARWLVAAALLFRLTLAGLEPAFTDDLNRYRWEGRVQAEGGNPYLSRPADARWAHLRDKTFDHIPGVEFPSIYGAFTLQLERWTWELARRMSGDPFAQAAWFKLPAMLFDLVTIALLWPFLRSRGLPYERIVIYAWSPLPVFEFWGMGHNDAIALAFLTAALLAAEAGRWRAAWPALALAAGAKLWPAGLVPLLRQGWRQSWLFFIAVAALWAPFWPGWEQLVLDARFASGFVGGWRNNDSLFGGLLWLAGGDFYIAKRLAFGLAALALATAVWLRLRPLEGTLVFVASLLLVSGNCHPWYLTWLLPLLVFVDVSPLLLWTVCTPLAHVPVLGWIHAREWQGVHEIRWLTYGPVLAWLAVWVAVSIRKRHARAR